MPALPRFSCCSSLPLRRLLLLSILLVVAPVVIDAALDWRNERLKTVERTTQVTAELADVVASDQADLIAAGHQLGRVLSELAEVKNRDVATVNRLLADIIEIYPQYNNILMVDGEGATWAAAVAGPQVSLADRRHFQNCRRTKQFSSGEYSIGKLVKKPMIPFAYPLLGPNRQFLGAVGISFNLELLDRFLTKPGSHLTGTTLTILDRQGVIVYSNDRPGRAIGKDERDDLFRRIVAAPDRGSFIDEEYREGRSVVALRKFRLAGEPEPHLYLYLRTPLAPALREASIAVLKQVGVILAAMMGALFVSGVMARRCVLDPIRVLRDAAHRLSDGDLTVRVSDRVTGPELGEVAAGFERMSRQMGMREAARQKAVRALLDSTRRYRALFNGASDAILVHWVGEDGMPGRFFEVNDAACSFLGYQRKELLRMTPYDIDDPMYRENIPRIVEGLLRDGHVVFETRHVTRDGRKLPVEVNLRLVTIQDRSAAYAICRNISNRHGNGRIGTGLQPETAARKDSGEGP